VVDARVRTPGRKPPSSPIGGGLLPCELVARCAGFLATGGGDLPLALLALSCCDSCEVCDDATDAGRGVVGRGGNVCVLANVPVSRRDPFDPAAVTCRLGGGGGGSPAFDVVDASDCWLLMLCSSSNFMRPTLAGSFPASYGGGSFLAIALGGCICIGLGSGTFSYGELDMLDRDAPGEPRGMLTQSGSSLCPNGFDGRFGLRAIGCPSRPFGTDTCARAGCLLSSHHFWRSELAGGSPGSMESYPIRSSSSDSSPTSACAVGSPTSALRRVYSSWLMDSRRSSLTMLTLHSNVAYTGLWSENRSGAESYDS